MKDFDRLYIRFKQFGGWRLVVQYAKIGVLWIGMKEIIRCAVKGKSMKTVYPKITERVDRMLWEKYGNLLNDTGDIASRESEISPKRNNTIWFCWLQGMDVAPELAHACLKSLRSLPEAEVVVIDWNNYKNYIEFPDYIVEKYRKGYIPHVMMSDLLRIALLSKHGGVWIDSTVLCTYSERHKDFWKQILYSEFFIFRYIRNCKVVGISNWFIAAKADNPIINDVLKLLYVYWKDYDCLVDYYMMHLFIGWSAKKHPEYIRMMPKGNSYHAIMLGDALEKMYDEKSWNNLTEHVLFHKMSYRHTERAKALEGSYYNHILREFAE